MYRYSKVFVYFLTILMLSPNLFAQLEKKSTGIGLRWGFWNMGNQTNIMTYYEQNGTEYFETGGLGGWLYFFSRTSDKWVFEFSVGGFGRVEGETYNHNGDDVDVTAVIPILLGVQRDFISIKNSSALRPYISFGGGPYWITNVKERDAYSTEEVISTMKPGVYAGGGMNFFLSNSFAVNFDLKYHVVDLDWDHDVTGLEMGLGFSILWGQYKNGKQ